MGLPGGYIGDNFIRAMAIVQGRDIVVLCDQSAQGFAAGAKVFYADPAWFQTKPKRDGTFFYSDISTHVTCSGIMHEMAKQTTRHAH